jgi:hypothetical protein
MGRTNRYRVSGRRTEYRKTKESAPCIRPAMQLKRWWYMRKKRAVVRSRIETGGRPPGNGIGNASLCYAKQSDRYGKCSSSVGDKVCAGRSWLAGRDRLAWSSLGAWLFPVVLLVIVSKLFTRRRFAVRRWCRSSHSLGKIGHDAADWDRT